MRNSLLSIPISTTTSFTYSTAEDNSAMAKGHFISPLNLPRGLIFLASAWNSFQLLSSDITPKPVGLILLDHLYILEKPQSVFSGHHLRPREAWDVNFLLSGTELPEEQTGFSPCWTARRGINISPENFLAPIFSDPHKRIPGQLSDCLKQCVAFTNGVFLASKLLNGYRCQQAIKFLSRLWKALSCGFLSPPPPKIKLLLKTEAQARPVFVQSVGNPKSNPVFAVWHMHCPEVGLHEASSISYWTERCTEYPLLTVHLPTLPLLPPSWQNLDWKLLGARERASFLVYVAL